MFLVLGDLKSLGLRDFFGGYTSASLWEVKRNRADLRVTAGTSGADIVRASSSQKSLTCSRKSPSTKQRDTQRSTVEREKERKGERERNGPLFDRGKGQYHCLRPSASERERERERERGEREREIQTN